MARFHPSSAAVTAALAFALAACSDAPVSPRSAPPPTPRLSRNVQSAPEQVMPGEVIVALRSGADARTLAARHGLALGRAGYRNAFVVMRGAAGSERAIAARLRRDARVAYAEPNYLRQPTTIDSRLWAFYNPGGLNMTYTRGRNSGSFISSSYASLADADEDNIEGYAAGGGDVVIGSIDTGVDFTHGEFTGRLIAGHDWYSDDDDPTDEEGHGTHTTGTMAGSTVGVAGVAGAAPHVKVYVQRVCGRRGCPTSAIVSAIRAAADYGVVAMNLSLGGSSESQAESDAIAYATSKGALVIASAGNDGTSTISCPACDPNAISVAATNWRDALTSYTNYGSGLDIAAPGGECYSNTTPEGCIYSAYLGGGYEWLQGTSMAAPQVTGTAAVVASKLGLRGGALRDRILSTADDLGDAGYDTRFGNGRVNSYRAVTGGTLPGGE
ncbi:MAG TPA: S8 family serine peptidase [Gemmatimonadaceae bacterium]